MLLRDLEMLWGMIKDTAADLIDQVADPTNGPFLTVVCLVLVVTIGLFAYYWKSGDPQ